MPFGGRDNVGDFLFASGEETRTQQTDLQADIRRRRVRECDQLRGWSSRASSHQFAHAFAIARDRTDRKIELGQREAQCRHCVSPKKKAAKIAAFHYRSLDMPTYFFKRAAIALPRSAGDFTVVTPAFSSAANLAAAVPLPPEMIAPAWPMRLPAGAEAPAMNETTGFVTYSLMNSAASSSALPPISPTMMMPSVCAIVLEQLEAIDEVEAVDRIAADADEVDWPRPSFVVWNTAS